MSLGRQVLLEVTNYEFEGYRTEREKRRLELKFRLKFRLRLAVKLVTPRLCATFGG